MNKVKLVDIFSQIFVIKDEDFWDFCILKNSRFLLFAASLICVLESMLLFLYYFLHKTGLPTIPIYYFLLLLCPIIVSLLLIGLLFLCRDDVKSLKIIQYFYVTFISIWSAIFAAVEAQWNLSAYLFIQITILNSVGLRIPSLIHCGINLVSLAIFSMILLFSDLSVTIVYLDMVNTLFMAIIGCFLVVYTNNDSYKVFKTNDKIKKKNGKLNFYANFDYLTIIPNRKFILEYFEKLLYYPNDTVCCMLVDIDNFKVYNDTYGHVMGDNCLVRTAKTLEALAFSNGGQVGRYGGEEFLMVFHNKSIEEIKVLSQKIVQAVEDNGIEFTEVSDKVVTISLGVFIIDECNRTDSKTAISFADKALYYVKKSGKNNFRIYNEMIMENT